MEMDDQCPGRLLLQAAIYNNVDLMESLLQGPEADHINAQDSLGRTAVYTSVTNNSYECAHLLLLAKADPNIACGTQCGGMAPLHAAVLEDKDLFVRLLLEHGGDLNQLDGSGEKPADLASKNHCFKSMIIISEKLDAEEQQKLKMEQDFLLACELGDGDQACDLLRSSVFSLADIRRLVNHQSANGHSLLYNVCARGDADLCSLLIENGAAVKVDANTGVSPLHIACVYKHASCLKILLCFHPELINIPTQDGSYPLHLACMSGAVNIITELVDAVRVAEDPFDSSKPNETANSRSMRLFRKLSALVNAPNARHQTPLHLAIIHNRLEAVRELLAICGPVSASHSTNKKPQSRSVKRQSNHETMLVDINAVDIDGSTPLHLAVVGNGLQSFTDIVVLLLQSGADPNAHLVSTRGRGKERSGLASLSPLAVVCERGDLTTVELLLRYEARDAGWTILATAILARNDAVVGSLLRHHHSITDPNFRINHAALASGQYEFEKRHSSGDQEPTLQTSSSSHSTLTGLFIDWHSVGLIYLQESWLQGASIEHMRRSGSGLVPEWLLENGGLLASYVITKLDISGNSLEELPGFLFGLPSLRVLIASNNRIAAIGDSKFNEILQGDEAHGDVFGRHIISEQVYCPYLEEIDLQHNCIQSLPPWMFLYLPALRRLDASHNAIESLSHCVWLSRSLVELNLSRNRLSSIVSSENDSLATLERFTDMVGKMRPGSPGSIASDLVPPESSTGARTPQNELEYADIPIIRVERWREADRVNVKMVNYDENDASGKVKRRSMLKDLDLSNNLFDNAPPVLACLAPSLDRLNLAHNQLKSIGPVNAFPAGLLFLDLSYNNIPSNESLISSNQEADELCNGLSDCSMSRSLQSWSAPRTCLSPFQHRSTPPLGQTLRSWSPFHASTSSLTSLSNIGCTHRQHRQLERLRSLRLDNNHLTTFAVCALDVWHGAGRTTAVNETGPSTSFSKPIDMPVNLKPRLSLQPEDCRIDSTNAAPFFPSLTLLDLSNNKLSTMSRYINELSQLAEMKISNNQLRELPSEMGLMKKLWYLDFSGCPVENTLRSILGEKAKKTNSVLGYLKSVRDEATPFNHMKLMFVGVQGIGKTSLLTQLRREEKATNPSTHWSQRMYQDAKDKGVSGENISTVGVDIGDLTVVREGKTVVFHTWDFGGQKEYYATHQYFLTKRSLYLVVWRLTDGEKGVYEILKWLISIQARAPNSPVIIVGTHRDKIKKPFPADFIERMTALIDHLYVVQEPDKKGLPRVMGHVEVSCRGGFSDRSTIKSLSNLIWKVVFDEQLPGLGGKLLEQKIPLSYLHLQEVICVLANERKKLQKDPVLFGAQYKSLVMEKMEEMFQASFHDANELTQATQFLHENGILLHYEDTSLQNYYFLDPQWLCDMLASVVTIPEINPHARSGVMKIEDMKWLFKGVKNQINDVRSYIVSLLQKFEVALLWDHDNLIIPSLLPTEAALNSSTASGREILIPATGCSTSVSTSSGRLRSDNSPNAESAMSGHHVNLSGLNGHSESNRKSQHCFEFVSSPNPAVSIIRLYVMSYFPCGFWPRLITRLLGDSTFGTLAESLYDVTSISKAAGEASKSNARLKFSPCPAFRCWQNGVELCVFNNIPVLRISEVPLDPESSIYRRGRLIIPQEPDMRWTQIDVRELSILEIVVPNKTISVAGGSMQGLVYPDVRVAAELLSRSVDRVDTLLEDWYPDIGARFAQNTRGTYLITRLVPCTRCLLALQKALRSDDTNAWMMLDSLSHNWVSSVFRPIQVSDSSTSSTPSPGGCQPPSSTAQTTKLISSPARSSSIEDDDNDDSANFTVYCFLVEQCIKRVLVNKIVFCDRHGNLGPYFIASNSGLVQLAHIAPDVVFHDVGDSRLISSDAITRSDFLGKGAFGAVYSGTVICKLTGEPIPAALKMLQPVKPAQSASTSQRQIYEVECLKWRKDSTKNCCDAYLNARKELSILLALNHDHIVPMLGISIVPLCLVLSLAPEGALSEHLNQFLRSNSRLPARVVRDVVLQISSALGYLHSQQIIYRDLKSENVLVWSFPTPDLQTHGNATDVKLADYGVSRVVLPSGTKGFAGTPSFMAPEIIQHNGEEPYTEKVDCFSFGMFVYELIMLKIPYEGASTYAGSNINIRGHVLAGGRPAITNKELTYPSSILDLMAVCWSRDPDDRPSANEIESFASKPEFCSIQNAVAVSNQRISVICACSVLRGNHSSSPGSDYTEKNTCDVWISTKSESGVGFLYVYTYREQECIEAKQLVGCVSGIVTSLCATQSDVWCVADSTSVVVVRQLDLSVICKFSATLERGITVKCMSYSHAKRIVYIALSSGNLVMYDATQVTGNASGSHVKVGNDRAIHCVLTRDLSDGGTEIWCGQSHCKIVVWNVDSTGGDHQSLHHCEINSQATATVAAADVIRLVSGHAASNPTVWSYVYPGTVIYCWDASKKSVLCTIDLLSHVPSFANLDVTFGYDLNKLRVTRSQVSCLNLIGDHLYVGTTFGCLVVINPSAYTVISVCRPYTSSDLSIILPLTAPRLVEPSDVDLDPVFFDDHVLCGESMSGSVPRRTFLMTVGRGYSDLVGSTFARYSNSNLPSSSSTENDVQRTVIVSWSDEDWPSTQRQSTDL